jgi:hypothetical protein
VSYPYSHRPRKQSNEVFAFKPLGGDNGNAVSGSASNQIADMATVMTYIVNPPYGAYKLALHAWGTAQSTSDVEVQVRPWVDHGQTIPGPALKMFEVGSATLVTIATISSNATSDGSIWQLTPGNGLTGPIATLGPVSHGFGVTVDINGNTTGKFDFELICQQTN